MEAVSRSNIYISESEDEAPGLALNLDIVEVRVDHNDSEPEEELEFNLFGGETIKAADLEVEEIEETVSRPLSFYFYKSDPLRRRQIESVAISGEMAAMWILDRKSTAPDVNANYVPKRRRCRPGSATRKRKIAKAEAVAAAAARARPKPRFPRGARPFTRRT